MNRVQLSPEAFTILLPKSSNQKIFKPLTISLYILYKHYKMNQKALGIVTKLNQHWTVSPVTTQKDIATALSLYEMFDEYSGEINDRKISSQRQKMQSHRHRYFLLKERNNKNQNNGAVGYYAADLQNPKYLGKILFDQMYVHPDHRGNGLGTFLTSHLLWIIAGLYYESITAARPAPKQIIAEHFRENTSNSQSLTSIKRTLKGFGFRDLPQKNPIACPRTYLPLDNKILDYHDLPF